jgi:Tfp pilus assembly protein PilF
VGRTSRSARDVLVPLFILLAAASCSRSPAVPVDRVALLKFENLTADPSFDWVATAAPRILAAELTGGVRTIPFPVETVRDAYLENATRLLHGYFDRRAGKLHFEIAVEDPERHKMISTASAEGEPLAAMNSLANVVGPHAREFTTSDGLAVSAWGKGDYEQAVKLDPDFGEAWLAWTDKLAASRDSARAIETAQRALARTGLRSSIERAQIELASATLQNDGSGRRAALQKLTQLAPADPTPRLDLAKLDMAARQFAQAARAYRDAIQAGANGSDLDNSLGYAEALAGDLDAARKAFEEYGREPGQGVNALDSLGEAFFINGKFNEAERAFLEAYAKDPGFLNGATVWKAAHARWLRGDLKGADGLLEKYWESRVKARDPLVVWRRSSWLYATGRREQAVMLLMHAPPEAGDIPRRQIALWKDLASVPKDLIMLQQAYDRADPVNDGLVRTFYAAAQLRAGHKDEARSLIARWPLPETGDNLLQSLLYPQYLELKHALQ